MTIKTTYFIIATLWILSFNGMRNHVKHTANYTPIDHQLEYAANQPIRLTFKKTTSTTPSLKISYSLGSTIVHGYIQDKTIIYEVPKFVSHIAGHVTWNLVNTTYCGNFYIKPDSQITDMETYVGPPSIIANAKDYSMVVTLPLDKYDNVQEDGTRVSFNYHKETESSQTNLQVEHLIAYDYVYSTKKTGNILLASSSGSKSSKEFLIEVRAGLPVDFTLSRKRNHDYADGNQLASFSTSILRDSYDNVVNDGTLVTFYITTSSGAVLQTTATTVNGVATGLMIHPEKQETWSIVGIVAGMAASNAIVMEFDPVFKDFNVAVNKEKRTVTVGPLLSFMKQIIPDGLTVELNLKGEKATHFFQKQSLNGRVVFQLNQDLIPHGIYNIEVTAGGITRTLENILL